MQLYYCLIHITISSCLMAAATALAAIQLAINLTEDIIKVTRSCVTATKKQVINEVELRRLQRNYENLLKRIERIKQVYVNNYDDFEKEERDEFKNLFEDIYDVEKVMSSNRDLFVQELLTNELNKTKFDLLDTLLSHCKVKALICEDKLSSRCARAVHPDAPLPTQIDCSTIKLSSHDSLPTIIITWTDDQFHYVKSYGLKLSSKAHNECITVEKHKVKNDKNECITHVENLHPNMYYKVSIRKYFENDHNSVWSLPTQAVHTVNHYPPTPQAVHEHEPFGSPLPKQFTISLSRPNNFDKINIKQCYITADTPDNEEPYMVMQDCEFKESEPVKVLVCDNFGFSNVKCSFCLWYCNEKKESTKRPLELSKKVGSLSPSHVNNLQVVYNDAKKSQVTVSWEIPMNNNAGAVAEYVVECYELKRFQRKDKVCVCKTTEVINSKSSVIVDGLVDGKRYHFIVYSMNFANKRSEARAITI